MRTGVAIQTSNYNWDNIGGFLGGAVNCGVAETFSKSIRTVGIDQFMQAWAEFILFLEDTVGE